MGELKTHINLRFQPSHTHTHIHTYTHTHIHTYTHTHIQTYMHAHTHTHADEVTLRRQVGRRQYGRQANDISQHCPPKPTTDWTVTQAIVTTSSQIWETCGKTKHNTHFTTYPEHKWNKTRCLLLVRPYHYSCCYWYHVAEYYHYQQHLNEHAPDTPVTVTTVKYSTSVARMHRSSL